MLAVSPALVVHAGSIDPWGAADELRSTLFAAQRGLLTGAEDTLDQVSKAEQIYRDVLRPKIADAASSTADVLDACFAQLKRAAEARDSLAFANGRGNLWAVLLSGSAYVVYHALERGDGETAKAWLMLREYRKPTRFARPGADATLAVNAFLQGKRSANDALTAVRVDLLDTYQARLNEALLDASEAQKKQFGVKLAEETGLAAGYFDILSDAYTQQRGEQATVQIHSDFDALMKATVTGDSSAFQVSMTTVNESLKHFRAAPLSEAEQARRAGQLLRYLSLVPIEYGRGIRDGKIANDIEIQEAITFLEGAQTAFTDLQLSLNERDSAATQKAADLLSALEAQIKSVAEPSTVETTANEVSATLTPLFPAEWTALNSGADFDVIGSVIDQIEAAAKQGEYALAESARIEAYAVLDTGIEQKLRGFAPDLAAKVENLFWQGDAEQPGLAVLLATRAPINEVKQGLVALRNALDEAQTLLENSKSAPEAVVGNAAIIVFREGLEAVVILASLVASLRGAAALRLRRSVMLGAGLSLIATAITWVIANSIINVLAKYGERLEAVLSLVAIGVLLLITNWFFHKTYWTGWMAELHTRKAQFMGGTFVIGPSLGLVILGFTSIYREGFETVLFLQSLVLDAGLRVVIEGVALGLVGVAIVGVMVFNLQMRLPYKKMMIVTGVLIGVVLLTMVGNTVHVLQAVGWVPITPIYGVYLPYWMGRWFGFFATWQGIIAQFAATVFVIGSYILAEHLSANRREEARSKNEAVTQGIR
ncbi:MAG: FTR1 family protein [Anaerolineae bacterium]|nr:FTR1 family protein [Anaerolineae bacterium]